MGRGKITDERQHELRSDSAHRSQERQRNEGGKRGGQAKTKPESCSEEDEAEDKGTAPDDVAEGTEEEETDGIAGLHDGGDERDAFIGDGEVSGEHGEDWVVVVEICYSEGCCLGSVSFQWRVSDGKDALLVAEIERSKGARREIDLQNQKGGSKAVRRAGGSQDPSDISSASKL